MALFTSKLYVYQRVRGWDYNDVNDVDSWTPGDVASPSAVLCHPGAFERLRGGGGHSQQMGEISISRTWTKVSLAHYTYMCICMYE